MARLKNKVAIVTGAARGLGQECAGLFVEEGATVVMTDASEEVGLSAAQRIDAMFCRHDVSSEDDWESVVSTTLREFGRIDVLVNNAGIFHLASLRKHTLEDFRRVLDVNVVGVFNGMKAVTAAMVEQQSGSIVNISSAAGLRASIGAIGYGASKFAVTGMTKTAALELAKHGVRVNSVHPGSINTDMLVEVAGGDVERAQRFGRGAPMKRNAEPGEIARMVLFLASDEASYSTGAEFVVDGGVTASM